MSNNRCQDRPIVKIATTTSLQTVVIVIIIVRTMPMTAYTIVGVSTRLIQITILQCKQLKQVMTKIVAVAFFLLRLRCAVHDSCL